MKILTTTIMFKLPEDFKGDDLNLALEEFIKYRRSKGKESIMKSFKENKVSNKSYDDMYNRFYKLITNKSDRDRSIHKSGIYKLIDNERKPN